MSGHHSSTREKLFIPIQTHSLCDSNTLSGLSVNLNNKLFFVFCSALIEIIEPNLNCAESFVWNMLMLFRNYSLQFRSKVCGVEFGFGCRLLHLDFGGFGGL